MLNALEELLVMYRSRLGALHPEFAEMNISTVEQFGDLRVRLRTHLAKKGVPSNPFVTDVWILDRIEEVEKGLPLHSVCNE